MVNLKERLQSMPKRVSVEDAQLLVWIGMIIGALVGVFTGYFVGLSTGYNVGIHVP